MFRKASLFSVILLSGTILSGAAGAAQLTPTLNTLKAQAETLSGNYTLTELAGDLPEGKVKVSIGDKAYYFDPTGDNAQLLEILAGTSAGNLVAADNGIFNLDGVKYNYNTNSFPTNPFVYAEGTAEDYSFTSLEADAEGNITTKYYKVTLDPDQFSTSPNITWTAVDTEGDGSIAVKLPNNQTKYFKYAYNPPEDYETVTEPELILPTITNPSESYTYQPGGAAVNNPAGSDYGDISGKVFKNNKVSGKLVNNTGSGRSLHIQGGAVYNAGTIEDINADFIDNYITGTNEGRDIALHIYGGAIYNSGTINSINGSFIGNHVSDSSYLNTYGGAIYNGYGSIGSITGDFIDNQSPDGGGAIYNYNATIESITGNFIGNSSSSKGGAIYNEEATIGSITGNFIGNYSSSDGSAIYNKDATVGSITGNFIGNYSSRDGGAIHSGNIGSITGNFIGNSSLGSTFGGGAISGGSIGSITGDFIGNHSSTGGAISGGIIGSITGNFIGNYALSLYARGGAISNEENATIGNITGDFIGNYASGNHAYGGAISNEENATIGNITGDFIGNYASNSYAAHGGAISNFANFFLTDIVTIGNITGNFIGNHASSSGDGDSEGGAIYNYANFNRDGAIAAIGDITGNFIGNYASSSGSRFDANAYGGAIYNSGSNATIGNITATIISDNKAISSEEIAQGGFLYNSDATIGNITATIISDNKAISSEGIAKGGFLYNDNGTIGNITGDIIGNEAQGKISALGGAADIDILNSFGGIKYIVDNDPAYTVTMWIKDSFSEIPDDVVFRLTGNNLINNKAVSSQGNAAGGAIAATSFVESGLLPHNISSSDETDAEGNPMTAAQVVQKLKTDYAEEGCFADTWQEAAQMAGVTVGKASLNFNDVTFDGNIAEASAAAMGGAVYSNGENTIIGGGFFNNRAQGTTSAEGGAIGVGLLIPATRFSVDNDPAYTATIWSKDNFSEDAALSVADTDFTGNKAIADAGNAKGGAIADSFGSIITGNENIPSSGMGMTAEQTFEMMKLEFSEYGYFADTFEEALQMAMADGITLGKISLNLNNVTFNGNIAEASAMAMGGAVYNSGESTITGGGFFNNSAQGTTGAAGGAIYNTGTLTNLTNTSFVGNFAQTTAGEAKGGAVYSTQPLNIVADNATVLFSDNYVSVNGVKTGNDIYMDGASTIDLNLKVNDGSLTFASGIDGQNYRVNISGQGTVNLNAPVKNAEIVHGTTSTPGLSDMAADNIVTNISDAKYLTANNSLTINSGMVTIEKLDNNLHLNKLAMNSGQLNIEKVGVDLEQQQMGTLTANEYDKESGTIEVKDVKVKTDGAEGITTVTFTDSLIADKVVSRVKESLGPVWKYQVAYNQESGKFDFTRAGIIVTPQPEDPTKPVKPSKPDWDDVNPEVMTPVVAAAATVAVLNDEIYSRVLNDVDAQLNAGKLVASDNSSLHNAWVKTFGSKDDVDLKGFAGADTKFYGLIGGLSSDYINKGNGWSAIYSVYGAYAGGEQKFATEKVTNNGGYLGVGANFYNGDFFIGTTLNAGMMRNRSEKTGIDGKDKFNSYVGGIAGKVGYDYHIGSFTVEPSVYASYTIIHADDYMTKSGAKVEFGNMGVIEAAPGLKLAKEFKDGMKGYISGRYVWNFTEGAHVVANQFDLPDVELENYAEYGIGFEKTWQASSGFIEVKRRDGGRSGWNFTAGFKTGF